MSITIAPRIINGIVVLDMAGRLDLKGAGIYSDNILGLLFQGKERVVLNLEKVCYIDSSGVGQLVASFKRIRNRGGQLKLLDPSKQVRDVLRRTKLDTAFEVFQVEADAIRSFFQND